MIETAPLFCSLRRALFALSLTFAPGLTATSAAVGQCAIQQQIGPAFNGPIMGLTAGDGVVYATGFFTEVAGRAAAKIVRRDASGWSGVGGGLNGSWAGAGAITTTGDLVVGGFFFEAGGVPALNIARWDGMAWSGLGQGCDSAVIAVVAAANGDVVAGGVFSTAGGVPASGVARWDGSSWSALGSGVDGSVSALAELPNGDLVAGGVFGSAGGVPADNIAIYDGASWSALGLGVDGPVSSIAVAPNGDVVVGGRFTNAGGVPAAGAARWNGSSWSALGAGLLGEALDLQFLPNGDLVAVGGFTTAGAMPAAGVARWDGTAWTEVGAGVASAAIAVEQTSSGELLVGGAGIVRLTEFRSSCPATAQPFASGCVGSNGLNELAAVELPWIGSAFESRATGLPSSAVTLRVHGFGATSVPLSALVPLAAIGCRQWVSADIARLYVPQGGALAMQLPIPNSAALAGVLLFEQVIAAELDAQNGIVEVTSSNALALTIGAF